MTDKADGKQLPKGSYNRSRFNATRHGLLSQYTVLPWEDSMQYQQLLEDLVEQCRPVGVIEEHCVEDIACTFWVKGRLRLAQKASHVAALQRTTEPEQFAATSRAALWFETPDYAGSGNTTPLTANASQKIKALERIQDQEKKARHALDILESGTDTYQHGLDLLDEAQQAEWHTCHEGVLATRRNATRLANFIRTVLLPAYRDEQVELHNQELIRDQAFGQSWDANELENLGRHETRLDRKLERLLEMLQKLQSRRSIDILVQKIPDASSRPANNAEPNKTSASTPQDAPVVELKSRRRVLLDYTE